MPDMDGQIWVGSVSRVCPSGLDIRHYLISLLDTHYFNEEADQQLVRPRPSAQQASPMRKVFRGPRFQIVVVSAQLYFHVFIYEPSGF